MATEKGNIYILSSDSLTYRHFQQYFDQVVDELDSTYFENAISTASNTNSAMPTLSAGVYAESTDEVGLPKEGDPVPIAEQLAYEGYQCGLWTDNFLFGQRYNYDRGFSGGNVGEISFVRKVADILSDYDILYDAAEWAYFNVVGKILEKTGGNSAVWKSAEELNQSALSWLDNNHSDPVFCWIHYMDNHHPYMPPKDYIKNSDLNRDWELSELGQFTRTTVYSDGSDATAEELEDLEIAYKLTCEYLADELTYFIRELKARDHFDPDKDTMVITADHGESFLPNPHGQLGHKNLWEDVIRVPLVVNHPGWDSDQIKGQVSLIDLMPTLLTITGHNVPKSAEGIGHETPKSMVRDDVFFSNSQPWWKIRRGIRTKDGHKLFGIKESINENVRYGEVFSEFAVSDSNAERIVEKRFEDENQLNMDRVPEELIEKLSKARGPTIEKAGDFDIDEQLEEHLKGLGYLES